LTHTVFLSPGVTQCVNICSENRTNILKVAFKGISDKVYITNRGRHIGIHG